MYEYITLQVQMVLQVITTK